MHYAARHGHDKVVIELIEKGADIEAKDNSGSTPLYYAAFNCHDKIINELIAKGANIETRNNAGYAVFQ